MGGSHVQERLAAHADGLIGQRPPLAPEPSDGVDQETAELMEVAARVRGALAPRSLPDDVRKRLEFRLVHAVSWRDQEKVHVAPSRPQAGVLLGAATFALAGGILYLARAYLQGRSQSTGGVRQ